MSTGILCLLNLKELDLRFLLFIFNNSFLLYFTKALVHGFLELKHNKLGLYC